ncbi:MAG: restriction endonuclease [Firmicutes bacterium]|nr:restriction endonuclease [Bacillota bacterium]
MKIDIPWHRYALIVLLTDRMHASRQKFGKTALQKLVYLLQAVFNVPAGYQYSLYLHGPFCSELANDLDYLHCLGGVQVSLDSSSSGYSITPSENAQIIKDKANDFLSEYQSEIDQLLDTFGPRRVKELELFSTIVFVDRDAVNSGRNQDRDHFIREIQNIKPHFSREEIVSTIAELESLGYIQSRT